MPDKKKTGEGTALRREIDTAALLAGVDIVKVIEGYVPLTKSGAELEACCPFHTESTPSFKVSPKKQFYNCFGCGANGDAIKFLMEYRGLSFLDACRELGADVPDSGAPPGAANPPAAIRRESLKQKKPEIEWLPMLPVPAHAIEPPKAHSHRGIPVASWAYRDAQGRVLGYIFKFIDSKGHKVTVPLTWCRAADGSAPEKWSWVSFPQPRPLYGLDELAKRSNATVLVVEGEKCKEAAQAELPELVVIAWPGGSNAEDKVDWSPLAERKVMTWADCDAKRVRLKKEEKDTLQAEGAAAGLDDEAIEASIIAAQAAKPLLPEADQPGVKAMRRVHKHLHMFNCTVWNIRIPAPLEKPDGWDVADAIDEGLKGADLAAHVRANAVRVEPPGAVDVIDPAVLLASENSESISTATGATAGSGSSGGGGNGGDGAAGNGGGDWYDDGSNDRHGQSIWRRMLLRADSKVIDCRENVYLILKYHPQWQGVIWGDEFAKRIVLRKPPPWERAAQFVPDRKWEASDDLRLGLWLAQQERVLIRSKQTLSDSVAWVASESLWHPVREYLDGLAWDGIERTRSWLTDYLGIKPTEYSTLAGHFFLIGMVARIYRPGCQMRFMPIFEGYQYRGKSSAIRALGGKWYSDAHLDMNNKDVYQLIQGVWLHEVAELDAFSKTETTRVKAFISSQQDKFRAPYEPAPTEQLRQVVFAGSTNQDEYFKDPTGNTRMWPMRVEEVEPMNVDGLIAVRDQLFAEAVVLLNRGERWHPTAEEQKRLFEPEQAAREIEDPWQPRIARWLRSSTFQTVRVDEILTDCLKVEIGKVDRARSMSTSVGIIMKRLGWIKDREPDGAREWFYKRPEESKPAQPDSAVSASEVDDVPL